MNSLFGVGKLPGTCLFPLKYCSFVHIAINNEVAAKRGSTEREGKPEWIRPRQVSELFGIGRGTVTTLIHDRKIRPVSLCRDGLARARG
jgi:hypothetical protein